MMKSSRAIEDETCITEITFQPDGRIYVFGTSREMLEILECLQPHDARLNRLLSTTRDGEVNLTENDFAPIA